MLIWDEIDVLTCLEVEPVVDEFLSYIYRLQQGERILDLVIQPCGNIWIKISRHNEGHYLDLEMFGCREIRYLKSGEFEKLLFISNDSKYESEVNFPYGISLTVRPQLLLKVGKPSVALEDC